MKMESVNNIIFLDIDGVMRTRWSDSQLYGDDEMKVPVLFERKLCYRSLVVLGDIIRRTGASVVITSTWKAHYKDKTIEKLTSLGIPNIIDVTKYGSTRGEEIQEYLDTHIVDKYVVLDDNIKDIVKHINPSRVIEVNPKFGLAGKNVEQISNML